jgi:hypothetical protein
MKTNRHFLSYLGHFFLECKMFHPNVAEKMKTHFSRSIIFFPPENRAVYETMWRNFAEPQRPQMTLRRIHLHAEYLWLQMHTHNT